MKRRYLPISELSEEILDFLWKRGVEGCVIYVPRRGETRTKDLCARILDLMEDDYCHKGRTFLDPNGRPRRNVRMTQIEAARRLKCGRKKVAEGCRRAESRWNRWFQDHEKRIRSELLSSLPRLDSSTVMLAYQAARSAIKSGKDPEKAMMGVVSPKLLKRENAQDKISKAAKVSFKSGPLREEERDMLAKEKNDKPSKPNQKPTSIDGEERDDKVSVPDVF